MEKNLSFFSKIKIVLISFLFISLLGISLGLLLSFIFDHASVDKMDPIDSSAQTSLQEETVTTSSVEENKITESSSNEKEEQIDDTLIQPQSEEMISSQESIITQSGTYHVGTDLSAGVYKLIAKPGQIGFYKIANSKTSNYLNITENDVFPTFTYINVLDGQFLELIDADCYPLIHAPSYMPKDKTYISGKYLVGKDIPPGDYIVEAERSFGYVEISSTPNYNTNDLLVSIYIEDSMNISIQEGQYLKLSSSLIHIE